MIPREAVDHILILNESEHRITHALLKPLDFYNFWTKEEVKIKRLREKLEIVIPKKFTLDQTSKKIVKAEAKLAVFWMMEIEGLTPTMFGYLFMGFSGGKAPKKS